MLFVMCHDFCDPTTVCLLRLLPLGIKPGKLHLQLAVRLLGGPRGESGNLEVPVGSVGKEPADLAQSHALLASRRCVVDPDARAVLALGPFDDEIQGAVCGSDGRQRRDAPVGVTIARDGAQLRGAVVVLEARLDPSPLFLVRGVARLEREEDAGLVVLLGPLGAERQARRAEGRQRLFGEGVRGDCSSVGFEAASNNVLTIVDVPGWVFLPDIRAGAGLEFEGHGSEVEFGVSRV